MVCGLNCFPPKSYAEILTCNLSISGDRDFKEVGLNEVTKVRPSSDRTGVLRRRGRVIFFFCLCTVEKPSEDTMRSQAIDKPRRKVSLETNPTDFLTLDFVSVKVWAMAYSGRRTW